MEFPPTWMVLLDEDFESAQPRLEGLATMELMAQVRHTGWILGNFRVALGGEARLSTHLPASHCWVTPSGREFRLRCRHSRRW